MFETTDDTRPVAVVLCGPPGSGKSTFRRTILPTWNPNIRWTLVSSDSILMDIAEKRKLTYTQAYETYINHATSQFIDALATVSFYQRPLILDRTHLTKEARKSTLAKLDGYRKVAVYFPPVDPDVLIERVNKREQENGQGVPADVIRQMVSRYEVPTLDEGFDEVIHA